MKQDVPNRFYSMGFEEGRKRGRLDNKGQIAYLNQKIKVLEKKLRENVKKQLCDVGFVCDNCGSETASCLTLCPDCLKEKGVFCK